MTKEMIHKLVHAQALLALRACPGLSDVMQNGVATSIAIRVSSMLRPTDVITDVQVHAASLLLAKRGTANMPHDLLREAIETALAARPAPDKVLKAVGQLVPEQEYLDRIGS